MVVQQAQDARGASLDAILVVALVAVHPHGAADGDGKLVHRLGSLIAVADVLLGTLLDIDDDGQGQAVAAGPDEVSGSRHRILLCSRSMAYCYIFIS